MTYTVGTLFSGIGVPDLAAHLLGMTTVWQVEREPYCQQVLRKNFPDAALHGDIFDCHNLSHVDVVVAGFPCQSFSLAGKRQGENDERYLVPEMFRVISEVKPRVVLFENVPGFASIADGDTFKQFLGALAEMGFAAEWGHLAASDFGAPHRRERWWCVAYRRGDSLADAAGWHGQPDGPHIVRQAATGSLGVCPLSPGTVAHASRQHQSRPIAGGNRRGRSKAATGNKRDGVVDDANRERRKECHAPARLAELRYAGGRPGADGVATGRRAQPRLGRDVAGLAGGLDFIGRWPARPGEPQHAWEPPRTIAGKQANRAARLKALGNTMCFPVVLAIMTNIRDWLEAQPALAVAS